ncbi:MAG: hypothetical protein ACP6IS_10810 [Candidatus Asgardarchaeia archaeon]
MQPPFPLKHPELRLDPIEFLILLKLKTKDYELKELTENIKRDFAGMMEFTKEDIFTRLENLRKNGFVSMETKGLISKKNIFKLTIKGEEKLREEIKYFEQDILMFNRFYSIVLGLLSSSFPKMMDDIKRIIEGSVASLNQTIESLTKPLRDTLLNMLNQVLNQAKSSNEESE